MTVGRGHEEGTATKFPQNILKDFVAAQFQLQAHELDALKDSTEGSVNYLALHTLGASSRVDTTKAEKNQRRHSMTSRA